MTTVDKRVIIIEEEEYPTQYMEELNNEYRYPNPRKRGQILHEVKTLYCTEEDVEDDWDLGGDLFTARIFSQLTQKQLSEQIGVSVSTIARMEKGVNARAKGKRIDVHKKTREAVQKFVSEYL